VSGAERARLARVSRVTLSLLLISLAGTVAAAAPALSPANGATRVSPDTHLTLTFASPPTIGTAGTIRIHDAADGSLVDTLDLSIPVSPAPTGRAAPRIAGDPNSGPRGADANDRTAYQLDVIGGVEFHFFPVIVRGNVATIYPHHGRLRYGRRYFVKMDPGVLATRDGPFAGFGRENEWRFATKRKPPAADSARVVVAADGSGDFATVQGALDFLPARPAQPVTVFVRNGDYEEIVFVRDKANFTIRGESREGVRVGYRNNSAFNPSRGPGTPSRRPAFSIHDVSDVQLSTFTIDNHFIGQAEALLARGQRIVLDRMTLRGSGDALTTYGTIYMVDSLLTGHGDTILAYAALYCLRCELRSIGPMTWTRTPQGSHGNVFVDSKLIALDEPLPWTVTATDAGMRPKSVFARLPRNSPGSSAPNFPYAEMVLIDTRTGGVSPEGWGPVEEPPGFDRSNVRFWEFNTMDLDGRPIDVSRRHEIAKQLKLPEDAATIANYRSPEFVLGGWTPTVR
jgi:pectinesterase